MRGSGLRRSAPPRVTQSCSRIQFEDRITMLGRTLRSVILAGAMMLAVGEAAAQTKEEAEPPRDLPPPLPGDLLKNADVIARGEKIWQEQCTHCHGSKAYPGKAPKLQPRLYKPEF